MVFIMVIEAALGISLFANIALFIFLLLAHYKAQPPQPQKSYDATQLMHDLTVHGQALVRVERVDASDIFLRGQK